MRNVVMWNMITLEGYFEGATKWDLDFHELVWGPELEKLGIEQTGGADMLLFGRVTYEGMAAYWPKADGPIAEIMNRIPKVVFSRTLQSADWNNTRLVASDAIDEVRRLKAEGDGYLLIFGSAELSAALIEQDLIDEFRLCLVPVLLGKGTPLFEEGGQKKLKLLSSRAVQTGGVILNYGLA